MNRPKSNGTGTRRDPGGTFEYEVRLEWGPRSECRRMHRIAEIADFVVAQLADIGVTDARERPDPDIARITIERIVPTATDDETGSDHDRNA